MAVVQVRLYEKKHRNKYPKKRRAYFLIGRNEDYSAFAHPVPSLTVKNAIKKGYDVIQACQKYIFKCDYSRVLRQGDIALIPLKRVWHISKFPVCLNQEITIEESHILIADEIRLNREAIYAMNPSIFHQPKTHPDLVDLKGWHKVVTGRRGNWYKFALPTIA